MIDTYIQDLNTEISYIRPRLKKLAEFLREGQPSDVSFDDWLLLEQQLEAMQNYYVVLNKRLDNAVIKKEVSDDIVLDDIFFTSNLGNYEYKCCVSYKGRHFFGTSAHDEIRISSKREAYQNAVREVKKFICLKRQLVVSDDRMLGLGFCIRKDEPK